MNFSSKLILSLFLSIILRSSFCSDNNKQKLHEELQTASQFTSQVSKKMITHGLLATLFGATGYCICDCLEQFICGPHSEIPAFSPCNGDETNKAFYTRMIYAGLTLAATGGVVRGYQQLSELGAQEKKSNNYEALKPFLNKGQTLATIKHL